MKHVTRPVLKYEEGQVGGHCIKPNFDILENHHDVKIAKIWNELNDNEIR